MEHGRDRYAHQESSEAGTAGSRIGQAVPFPAADFGGFTDRTSWPGRNNDTHHQFSFRQLGGLGERRVDVCPSSQQFIIYTMPSSIRRSRLEVVWPVHDWVLSMWLPPDDGGGGVTCGRFECGHEVDWTWAGVSERGDRQGSPDLI